jgi:hypothetical protein
MSSAAKARDMETNATSAMDTIVLTVLARRPTALLFAGIASFPDSVFLRTCPTAVTLRARKLEILLS